MSKYTNLKDLFTAIATAIRFKTGNTAPIVADDFPAAIEGIESGGVDLLALKESMTVYRNDEITELPAYAFSGCKNLTHAVLPAVQRYDGLAFVGSGMKIVEFSSLKSFGAWYILDHSDGAFADINNHEHLNAHVVLRQEPPNIYDPEYFGIAYFYIPREYVEVLYENYEFWDEFSSDKIRILEDYTVDGTITGELDVDKMMKQPNVPH